MENYLLDDLLLYARCPLEWFWERQAHLARPTTPAALIPFAIKQGISFYYAGLESTIAEGVASVWQDWLAQVNQADLTAALAEYAGKREAILAKFDSGEIHQKDGGKYQVPRMTNEYQRRMHAAGALTLGARLDKLALMFGVVLPESYGHGSPFGDAYGDSLRIAARAGHPTEGVPAREAVVGWQAPYQVDLGRFSVAGRADIVLAPPVDQPDQGVTLEIHDYRPGLGASMRTASRDLRVVSALISASNTSIAVESYERSATWAKVARVVYRHLLTGTTAQVFTVSPGRLLAVVAAAARGMRSQSIIPRMQSNSEDCRPCAYRPTCYGDHWLQAYDTIDQAALANADRLRKATAKARKAIHGDGPAAKMALAALAIIENEITAQVPDLVGVLEVVAESERAIRAELAEIER